MVKAVVALGAFVHAIRLRLVFLGGIIESAFKAFVPASLLFALARRGLRLSRSKRDD